MKLSHSLLALATAACAALNASAATPAANWSEHCAKCHGEDGKGDTKMGKKLSIADLTSGAIQAKFTDEEAFKAMKEGLTDKAGKTTMKAIEKLSDDEMKAMIPVVRALKK